MAIAPSPHTRNAFREHLVGTFLGYIDDVFQGAGLERAEVPPARAPSGQRRNRVEEYYAGIDWSSPTAVGRLFKAYEQILADADDERREKLVKQLGRDGLAVDQTGRILPIGPLALGQIDVSELGDPEVFRGYERRILESVDADPELAIGSSKELVEAACQLLLEEAGIVANKDWSAERRFKEAAKTLDLTVDAVNDAKAGAESVRKALRGLHQVVIGTAELRNRYGTGHGRHRKPSGLGRRHARLAAGAAITLTRFLLETRQERTKR